MAEQCAFYVRCDRCQYGRNLGSNEYGCRKHLAPDGKTIHRGQYSCENGGRKMKINKIKIDVANATNQAIRFVKSNPCHICSCKSFCNIKYKGTCQIWKNLKAALIDVQEVKE